MHRPQRPLVYALTLAAIVLLGFSLRVYKLDGQSLWYDESVTAQVVQQGVGSGAGSVDPARLAGELGQPTP